MVGPQRKREAVEHVQDELKGAFGHKFLIQERAVGASGHTILVQKLVAERSFAADLKGFL